MRVRRRYAALILGILAVYAGVIVIGVHLHKWASFDLSSSSTGKAPWHRPSLNDIDDSKLRDNVRWGQLLFNETPLYAAKYAHAKISCASCHAEGGIQPFASPVVGVAALFPMYNERAGHNITLKDRIEECFVRSENGKPLDYNSPEMLAIVDYINWLSQPEPDRQPFLGRGLLKMPDLKPDPVRGKEVYASQCAGCHGRNGEGKPYVFPPLWGDDSFNDGAGMHGVGKMAAFIQHNMPQNRMGILTPQEAYDVSSFIHNQPRPKFDTNYSKY